MTDYESEPSNELNLNKNEYNFNLLPGEELLDIRKISEPIVKQLPSALRELKRLSGANRLEDIGDYGPVLASLPIDDDESNPEKRLFEVVFGRDSLRASIDLIEFFPKLVKSTLVTLAENQGTQHNASKEEEPGRIPHEIRDPNSDALARKLTKDRGWGWPYYGSVDSTPLYIQALAEYCRLQHDAGNLLAQKIQYKNGEDVTIARSFISAVEWLVGKLDSNKEGLLEYKSVIPGGIENQVWKDSFDAYFHKDGTQANHQKGVASVEVQALAYDALIDAAEIWQVMLGNNLQSRELIARSEILKQAIFDYFWNNTQGGFFVLGTDRATDNSLTQLQIKTSNMGHLLNSRLLADETAQTLHLKEAVVRQLFSEKMLGLNGVRTLAIDEYRYRPGAYHNGSVWVWDNYYISQGLSERGYHELAHNINDRLLADVTATKRFPEFLRGDNDPGARLNTHIVKVFDKKIDSENTVEQPPQDVQAWTVASIASIKMRRRRGQHETVDPRKRLLEQEIIKQIKDY